MFGPIAGFKGNKRQRDFVMFLSLSFVSWQWGTLTGEPGPRYACRCSGSGGVYCIINRIVGSSSA